MKSGRSKWGRSEMGNSEGGNRIIVRVIVRQCVFVMGMMVIVHMRRGLMMKKRIGM